MFAIFGAINLLPRQINASRSRLSARIFVSLRSVDSSLFNALKTPKPLIGLKKTIRMIGAIKKAIVIIALAASNFWALPQSVNSIQPIPLIGTAVIATGHWSKKTRFWVKSLVTIITRKSFLLTNTPSPISQKTNIGLSNLYVGNEY